MAARVRVRLAQFIQTQFLMCNKLYEKNLIQKLKKLKFYSPLCIEPYSMPLAYLSLVRVSVFITAYVCKYYKDYELINCTAISDVALTGESGSVKGNNIEVIGVRNFTDSSKQYCRSGSNFALTGLKNKKSFRKILIKKKNLTPKNSHQKCVAIIFSQIRIRTGYFTNLKYYVL